jgi:hypothetical protein
LVFDEVAAASTIYTIVQDSVVGFRV